MQGWKTYASNIKEHSWSSLIGQISPRAHHAAVCRSKTETLYILGGIQLADDNAVRPCCKQEITVVKISFALPTPQFLSSQAATICDNIIHIFGGYQAYASAISTKPNLSSTLSVFDAYKKLYLSKLSKPEHATAGHHSMFLLDNSTLLIYGGTEKEIL